MKNTRQRIPDQRNLPKPSRICDVLHSWLPAQVGKQARDQGARGALETRIGMESSPDP